MIDIEIEIDNNKILKKIIVNGHSGFANKGNDIVCAAVSILVYAAYLSFLVIPDLKIEYIDNENKVSLSINNKKSKDFLGELRGISIYLITGIKALAKKYKENINVKMI